MKMRNVLRILVLAIVMLAIAAPVYADVWLPSSLTEIEAQAFMNAMWLSGNCTIPEGTKTIGNQAFYGCSGITSLKLASTVRRIGAGAFANCTGLTGTVTIPAGCDVAEDAFDNCPNLTVVYEKANTSETSLFTWKISGGKAVITGYKGGKGITSLTIPSSLDGCPVTGIDEYVFSSNRYLTHVTLPATIETIGSYAFSYCPSLTSVSMPTTVRSLGRYAFYYSSELTGTFELVDAEIPSNAFTGCDKLSVFAYESNNGGLTLSRYYGNRTSVSVPHSVGNRVVTAIGREAFSYSTALQSVSLPTGLTTIGPSAFYYCTALKNVSIPYGVTEIGANAFYNCESIQSLSLPGSITSIGSMAFCECDALTGSYSFINAQINSSAFSGLSGVSVWCYERVSDAQVKLSAVYSEASSISVPATVQNHAVVGMKAQAFYNSRNVTSISLPETFTAIADEAFYKCTTLQSISIPATVKTIGTSAFYGCSALTSVSIPAGVSSVGPQAFYNCTALSTLNVASGSTELGAYAFANCSKLSNISMPGNFTNVGNMTLTGTAWLTSKLASVARSVTAGCASDYERARALHDWLVESTAYDLSYTYYGPEGVLFHGLGVCNSYTVTYSKLLSAVGIENKTVTGTATDRGSGNTGSHAWTLVKLDGIWYHVDTTWDDPIPDGRERHTYFCLTDSQIAADHQWNKDKYPAANGKVTLSASARSVEQADETVAAEKTENRAEEKEEAQEQIQTVRTENHRKDKKKK